MSTKVKAIPEGYHTMTPFLTFQDSARAIAFYERALGATELSRNLRADGKVMHAAIKIGDSVMMLADDWEPPPGAKQERCLPPTTLKGTTVNLYLYVENVDAVFNRAVEAGARVVMPVSDMFWGDRFGQFLDPFGHSWSVATHQEDRSSEQVDERMAKFFAQQSMV